MSIDSEGTSRSRSPDGDSGDVRSSLAEMDRRLRGLQRDLPSVGSGPPPAPPPEPVDAPASATHFSAGEAEAAADAARQFLRSAQALVEEYQRAIRRASGDFEVA